MGVKLLDYLKSMLINLKKFIINITIIINSVLSSNRKVSIKLIEYIIYSSMLLDILNYNKINPFFIFDKIVHICMKGSYKFLSDELLIQNPIFNSDNIENSQDSDPVVSESRDQDPDEDKSLSNEREKPPTEEEDDETSSLNDDERPQDLETPLSEEEELRDDSLYSDIIGEDYFRNIFDSLEFIATYIIENNLF